MAPQENIPPASEDTFWGRCAHSANPDPQFGNPHWRPDNTCSHCGGVRPSIALKAIKDGGTVEPTDKNYKMYVRHHLVTSPGGKCYFNHFSVSQAVELVLMWHMNKITFAYPGSFYRGLCFADYRTEIEAAVEEAKRNGLIPPPAGEEFSTKVTEHDLLVEANELLRSAFSIAEREGKETNWDAFKRRVQDVLVKQSQHLKNTSNFQAATVTPLTFRWLPQNPPQSET